MRLILLICFLTVTAAAQIPPIEPGVSQELAKWRASQYSNISYKLNLTLEKMSPVLRGSMEVHVTQAAYACAEPNCPPMAIILDWRKIPGHENDSKISNVKINGKSAQSVVGQAIALSTAGSKADAGDVIYGEHDDHLIFHDGVRMGENVIKLDFTSPILTSGSAITRYIDKEDGAEYIYSLFVPSDASTAFPVFDQPDLKARFQLNFLSPPKDWKIVTNTGGFCVEGANPDGIICWYEETKPISTYVFAFASGPWSQVSEPGAIATGSNAKPKNPVATAPGSDKTPPTSIYVRKSQAEKFNAHSKEVFRLNREAVKYLETYFDYKFPWPKYELVLIPEFPFGGMEHAGATFLREQSVIFPQEPTKNDIISRANLIFHEAAHQWFGDTVTMKWFDDLWLKEGFAEFMAYKTLEKVMPGANAWKVFYERNKQAAYATDSTKGTTPIYQPIANLNSAKSAYGNIVYRKAPSFLRQAEFYLGEDKFQTAVRAFLKKHEFNNSTWEDLVKEFEVASGQKLDEWASTWITRAGLPIIKMEWPILGGKKYFSLSLVKRDASVKGTPYWRERVKFLAIIDGKSYIDTLDIGDPLGDPFVSPFADAGTVPKSYFALPNYQDYAYGIFLLDDKSRDYVLKNIQNEKDDFLRTMMWGSLWDSVREAELDPKDYVELVIKNIGLEKDEGTIQTLLSRVTTAMNYYMSEPAAVGLMQKPAREQGLNTQRPSQALANARASATGDLRARLEDLLIDKIQNASTAGQRITYYRAFLNIASTDRARDILKQILKAGSGTPGGNPVRVDSASRTLPTGPVSASSLTLRTKDKFDIVTRLAILGDPDAPKLLAELEKTETSDDAKRYAYAVHAAFATTGNKAKFFNDFLSNKDISESWIEAAFGPFNSVKHSELTLPYLERALAELPNLKRNRKIFFVNGWLGAFIGGQRDEKALGIIDKFLADNPKLDTDLRLKILENSDLIERAIKIRAKYGKN